MTGQELATAIAQDACADPRSLLQQRHVRYHPHASGTRVSRRVIGTALSTRIASSPSLTERHGERVERTEAFAPAFERAVGESGPGRHRAARGS